MCIGVDFGGQPGGAPLPQNRGTPMHLSVFTTFCSPPKFGLPPIFLTSLRRVCCVRSTCICVYLLVRDYAPFNGDYIVLIMPIIEELSSMPMLSINCRSPKDCLDNRVAIHRNTCAQVLRLIAFLNRHCSAI